jgi:hypothetical protein|tara:strand:+ start:190 stop:606 length:417 start_codon:yes stop_codon:yes gene_type:complete
MIEIASITTALGGIKAVTDLVNVIKDSKTSLSDAETKLKFAELIENLADIKMQLADFHGTLREKDEEIQKLLLKINKKAITTFEGGLYWVEGDTTPFCPSCYESKDKEIHLTYSPALGGDLGCPAYRHCQICKNSFSS